MSGINLFTSNKLELLVERLATEIREHPLSVFEEEVVVVQSKGMQHWLSLEIAERNSICANTVFPFPKAFVNSLFQGLVEIPERDSYSPDNMTWRIMSVLPGLLKNPEFNSLNRYCEGAKKDLKLFQLSEKIAVLFDKYLVHRPELINEWDRDRNPLSAKYEESKWQFLLWRAISEADRTTENLTHAAELRLQFLTAGKQLQTIPKRVSVFGISSLPPYYLDILKKLAEQTEVYFYYLNPCRQFWEYCYSEKETSRYLINGINEEDQYFEEGNPLLASMGVAGREFFSLILNVLDDVGDQNFIEAETSSLLNCIQADILNLVDRNDENKFPIAPTDRSLQIHSCHTPIREVEVLYDNLLDLFSAYEDLNPKDVVIMMPDVSIYAPLIRAVFDGQELEKTAVPYSITDISLESTSVIAETFLAILALNSKRFKAPDVLDILESQAVREKFDFSDDDINLIKNWVIESGIRWGVDGKYKEKLGLPAFEENTWQFGLKRLLLGIALPEKEDLELFSGISPYSDMEGDETLLLGRFARFIELLIDVSEKLTEPRNLEQWSGFLNGLLSDFFAVNDQSENELQEIREILLENGLLGVQKASDYKNTVALEVIVSYLNNRLAKDIRSTGFISRGVTFCTLLPMRSIPFKVIYILGMNDGDFPRTFQRTGFDLTEHEKRLCDRSKRDEDKYLFLESILSARDHLIISYIGQDISDNSERPPSVLVEELCDVISRGFVAENNESILKKVITKHPLQPFNPSYFDPAGALFSYSTQNLEAAKKNNEPDKKERSFLSSQLPEPAMEDWSDQSLEQFCRFFHNPSDFILKNRLSIQAKLNDMLQAADREPFDLDNLQLYKLKEGFINHYLKYPESTSYFDALKAKGELSHGTPGKMAFDALKQDTSEILSVIGAVAVGAAIEPQTLVFRSEHHPFQLGGVLRSLSTKGQLFFRSATVKARDILSAWLYHLMMCQTSHFDFPRETFFVGKDKVMAFSKLEESEARGELENLVELFFSGLVNPLPFFPQSSLAFAQSYLKKAEGNVPLALSAAEKIWNSGYNYRGEQENDAFKLCFGDLLPGNEVFRQTAISVYQPIFEFTKEKKLNEFI